ncbi:MAG: hypothetical protein RR944_08850 [Acinetobacter sp.]
MRQNITSMQMINKKQRELEFYRFKQNYEYFDLTISEEKTQAFERYISGEIDAEQLQRIFHKLSGSQDNFILITMDEFC